MCDDWRKDVACLKQNQEGRVTNLLRRNICSHVKRKEMSLLESIQIQGKEPKFLPRAGNRFFSFASAHTKLHNAQRLYMLAYVVCNVNLFGI